MGKVGNTKMRKEKKGREMYFCKMAPRKTDMQTNKEKAKSKGAWGEMKIKMKWYVKERDMVDEFLQEDSVVGLPFTNLPMPCQFHAQQPTRKEAVCISTRIQAYS